MSESASSDAASPSRASRAVPGVAAAGAKQVVRGRRLLRDLQSAVSSTSERVGAEGAKMWAKSNEAWASVDSRLGLGAAVSEAAAKAEERLQLREKVAAADRRFQLSAKAQELSQDLRAFRDKADVQQGQILSRLNKALVRATTKMVDARCVATALDPEALCFYDAGDYPGIRGLVALTVDDAPCRQRCAEAALLPEVKDLLDEFDAKATFFLCTDDVPGHEEGLLDLLMAGHEVANHGCADRPYGGLSEAEFREVFHRAESVCESLRREASPEASPAATCAGGYPEDSPAGPPSALEEEEAAESRQRSTEPRWFRAPHADMSSAMRKVLAEEGFTHVLCDSFANDTQIDDPAFIAESLLSSVDPNGGSIIVIHMPERGFREHNLAAMRLLLEGLRRQNLRAVTVSALSRAARSGLDAPREERFQDVLEGGDAAV